MPGGWGRPKLTVPGDPMTHTRTVTSNRVVFARAGRSGRHGASVARIRPRAVRGRTDGQEPPPLPRQQDLTYLATGVPVLLSATPAQAHLGQELGAAAIVYEPGDVAGLAERLSCLARDSNLRMQARHAARSAALRRWHWEHPDDRGALVETVRAAFPRLRMMNLRLVITADPYIPVPPLHYGGIERVIDVLVRELVRRGHDVTLVAHPDSRTPARLVPYGEPPHEDTAFARRSSCRWAASSGASAGTWTSYTASGGLRRCCRFCRGVTCRSSRPINATASRGPAWPVRSGWRGHR